MGCLPHPGSLASDAREVTRGPPAINPAGLPPAARNRSDSYASLSFLQPELKERMLMVCDRDRRALARRQLAEQTAPSLIEFSCGNRSAARFWALSFFRHVSIVRQCSYRDSSILRHGVAWRVNCRRKYWFRLHDCPFWSNAPGTRAGRPIMGRSRVAHAKSLRNAGAQKPELERLARAPCFTRSYRLFIFVVLFLEAKADRNADHDS